MQALQFSVSIPQWIALKALGFASRKPFYKGQVSLDGMVTHTFSLDSFDEMIEVNLAKEKHGAVKTAVSFMN